MGYTARMAHILCILAGGRSSRFGSSKLNVQLDGKPMVQWISERLAEWEPDEIWLSVAPQSDQPSTPGWEMISRVVHDDAAHQGPLSGIVAAVAQAKDDDVIAFVPVDMPAVTAGYLDVLTNCLMLGKDHAAAMAKWAVGDRIGEVEPLPSVWRAGPARALLAGAAAEGLGGPRQLAERPGVVKTMIHFEETAAEFVNFNRREELEAIAQALGVRAEIG